MSPRLPVWSLVSMGRRRNSSADLKKAQAMVKQGHTLLSARRFDEAVRLFAQAARDFRWEPAVLLEVARAYISRKMPQRAMPLLAKAYRLNDQRLDLVMAAGECYRRIGDFRAAEECFLRATRLVDSVPMAELELAHICERTHRLEEAADYCQRLLKKNRSFGPAIIIQARVMRRQSQAANGVELLRSWLESTEDSPACAEGWGELALAYDDLGEFQLAWDAITETKRILAPRASAERAAAKHVGERFRTFVENISSSHTADWIASPSWGEMDAMPSSLVLLTGFPRSGTTLLERVLDEHPRIVSMEEKDIFAAEVFSYLSRRSHLEPITDLLSRLDAAEIQAAQRKYLQGAADVLGDAIANQILLDKNPALTLMIPVYLRLFPQAKIIMALRDPRDVALSCYLRYLPLNPVSANFLSLESLADFYLLNLEGWLRYRELFPTAWMEVKYEETVASLESTALRCLEFLGVPWDERVLAYREHTADRAVLSPTYEAVNKPIFASSIGRWKNYSTQLGPILHTLDAIAKRLGF